MKKLLVVFPGTQNIHLTKDVGMLPYVLYKELGYEATIASYENGDYPYLQKEVLGLKQVFIKKFTSNLFIDVGLFLLLNFRQYNILQVYHFGIKTLSLAFMFRCLKLFNGKTYLKLDADESIKTVKLDGIIGWVYKALLNKFSLVSVETKELSKWLSDNWHIRVEYIPNGFYDYSQRTDVIYQNKENIIITIGRIGTKQKATEILCQGFKDFALLNEEWNLEVVGPVEPGFSKYIEVFFKENPSLIGRINFTGAVYDRELLYRKLLKSKIFVLSSRWESFGLVYLEAMNSGCYIVSTDIIPARDITRNGDLGSLFPVDDSLTLTEILSSLIANEAILKSKCTQAEKFLYDEFYLPVICRKIDNLLFNGKNP